jgi:hypothetical protein
MTHTVAELEISFAAYVEIRSKLIQAGYAYVDGAIDMTGIAIAPPAGTVKHDQIACSLTNRRGLKCTCDAYDSAAIAELSTETVDNPVESDAVADAAAIAEREAFEPVICDFCGAQVDDPWHTSDATRKHLHQCDACHATSGQKLTDGQIATIEEAQIKLENIGHIFAGDKQARRLAAELKAILGASCSATANGGAV